MMHTKHRGLLYCVDVRHIVILRENVTGLSVPSTVSCAVASACLPASKVTRVKPRIDSAAFRCVNSLESS